MRRKQTIKPTQAELDRLAKENAELKAKLAQLEHENDILPDRPARTLGGKHGRIERFA